jgi:hypothetical protein
MTTANQLASERGITAALDDRALRTLLTLAYMLVDSYLWRVKVQGVVKAYYERTDALVIPLNTERGFTKPMGARAWQRSERSNWVSPVEARWGKRYPGQ